MPWFGFANIDKIKQAASFVCMISVGNRAMYYTLFRESVVILPTISMSQGSSQRRGY
jgi:hypothetical protein